MQQLTPYRTVLLHLSLIEDIGSATIAHLMALCEDPLYIYQFSASDFINQFHVTSQKAEKLVAGLSDKKLLDRELELLGTTSIRLLFQDNGEYPELLKTIYAPPVILYAQGAAFDQTSQCLAVVGARKANTYGKNVVDAIIPDLIKAGFTIVSGGARGLDTMAHKATLKAGGKTIVVLGSGLLNLYPQENTALFDEIIQNSGMIISPFPPTMDPLPENFPARNRIISGISKGCVVVQAAQESGARITARFALDQGREVFAVPGSIFDPLSKSCHDLLEQGATLASSSADILQAFGYATESKEQAEEQLQIFQPESLEGKILNACSCPRTFDEIQAETQLSFGQLNDLIFNLQLEGHLIQTSIGLWQAR